MADIFISYSRKDSDAAHSLRQRLAGDGYDVWIDVEGIYAATAWSKEIVEAIDGCKVFMVLLSPNSLASANVTKEVSIASESRKIILPVDVEKVRLTTDLRYQLAGLQRVSISDTDAIIRGLEHLNVRPDENTSITVNETSLPMRLTERISIAVLPFDDLSPTKDNDWFAEGLTNELVSSLGELQKLNVTDRQTARNFKNYNGSLAQIAKSLGVRYLITGEVRKHNQQIKVNIELYDGKDNRTVQNDSYKGVMDDIFDIQEKLARKTAHSLNLTLSLGENKKLEARPTLNRQAYEYYLKAKKLFFAQTKHDWQEALPLFDRSIALDPDFAGSYAFKALTLVELYRRYDKKASHLDTAETLIAAALERDPHISYAYWAQAVLFSEREQLDEAIAAAKKVIELQPNNASGYAALGVVHNRFAHHREAIVAYEQAKALDPSRASNYWNMFVASQWIGDIKLMNDIAKEAIPVLEPQIELDPTNTTLRSYLASFYLKAGRTEQAAKIIYELLGDPNTDSSILYDIACNSVEAGDLDAATAILRAAMQKGFQHKHILHTDPSLDALRDRSDFKMLLEEFAA